ncbi:MULTISPECIES: flippase [Methanobacterium]|uniref:Flippase n=1 Tax=Methanobacterium veterum TaxID=408577 RepID=A0A9E4ZYB1_9EURY|nr:MULTISPECIES: flippase [Methanobacterium]MCZ3367516.1 flippase [Methanobacterium veterum]MCZ3373336.1 flippase [Methanobacterium veterum]
MAINNIFKNFSSLFVSNVIINILSFLYTLLLARYLGVGGFGILSLAIALGGIFGIITDLGFSGLMTREVSRNKSLATEYLSNILCIRFVLAVLTFIIAIISLNLMDYSYQTKLVVYLITLSSIVSAIMSTYSSIFQSHEKMEYQAFGQTLNVVLIFIGILIAINLKFNVTIIALIYLLSSLIILFLNIIMSKIYLDVGINKINKKFWKPTIRAAIPFSLSLIFATVYFRVDVIILSLLQGEVSVGIYTASYNLLAALIFIPMIFTTTVLPLFSKLHIESQESLKTSYEKTFKYLLIIAIPIAIIATFYANNIILLIYGLDFKQSILSLQILIWTVPFIFATYLFRTLLISINKQNLLFKIILICLILNILFNLILIPFYGYLGSSVVNVLTEFIFFSICFRYISKYLHKVPLLIIFRILLSGIAMLILIYLLNSLNIFIALLGSIIAYIISLFYLRIFSKEELKTIIVTEINGE